MEGVNDRLAISVPGDARVFELTIGILAYNTESCFTAFSSEQQAALGAVLHEVTASPFDHAGRDQQTVGESTVVVQQLRVLDEIVGDLLDGLGGSRVEAVVRGHQAHAFGDRTAATAAEQPDELMFDPRLGRGVPSL